MNFKIKNHSGGFLPFLGMIPKGKSVRDFMKNAIDDAADTTDDVKKNI